MADKSISIKGDYIWRGVRKNGGILSMNLQLGRAKPINYLHDAEMKITYKPSQNRQTCFVYVRGGNHVKNLSGRIYDAHYPISEIINQSRIVVHTDSWEIENESGGISRIVPANMIIQLSPEAVEKIRRKMEL
jgi:hypothetical protein